MFDEFAYRNFQVRAGVRQSHTVGAGWYGIVCLAHDSEETTFSLMDRVFDWPGAARRHAAHYAKQLIDLRLDGPAQRADSAARSSVQASLSR
jgi:hypothetical protein